jgi:hypothetical protein
VQAKAVTDGEELTITGNSAADEQKIRALGFMGIMVLGTHQNASLGYGQRRDDAHAVAASAP